MPTTSQPDHHSIGDVQQISRDDQGALLALSNVCKTYVDGNVEALKNVSFQVAEREFLSIMGPSGCGKSTLLNMLGALDRPTSGEVLFDGEPLTSKSNLDQLRAQRIGFVFQSFYLLPNLTALENVQLPMFESPLPVSQRPAEARRLLELVGLQERERHLPDQLSIGQRQRVSIARALANAPSLILADEPTGSLDSQSGREVMELLTRLNAEHSATLIIVTHDQQVAECGSRTIQMLDGQILKDEQHRAPHLSDQN